MMKSWKAFPRLLLGLAMSVGLASDLAAQVKVQAQAQEKDKIPNALDRAVADPDDEPEPRKLGDARLMQFDMEPERWADMAYSTIAGNRGEFEQILRRRVRMVLNQIEQLCGTSPELREKVTEAADLEFQRLDADIAALVAEAPRRPTQEQYEVFYRKIDELTSPFRPAFFTGNAPGVTPRRTVWEKVLQRNLTEEQREIIETDKAKRAEYRSRVRRLEILLQVSRVLGLSSKQLQDLERVADASPAGWTSLEYAWSVLSAMPEAQQKEYFTESQRIRLSKPLEYTNDLRPVMLWELNP